jgi:menaquinone-specific isochorismate synthase
MPVIPYPANLIQDSQALYQLLSVCQQKSIAKNQTQIVSISLEIPVVDPLEILQEFAQPHHLHFYFDSGRQKGQMRPVSAVNRMPANRQMITGIDAVMQTTLQGKQRFSLAQDFIQTCLANTTTVGALHLPFAGPHFFCSFTFFDDNKFSESPFPCATIFLPRWQIARKNHQCVLVANVAIKANSAIEKIYQNLQQTIQKITFKTYSLKGEFARFPTHLQKPNIPDQHQFKKSVLLALDSIRANHYHKVVLAHAIDVISQTPFQVVHSLNKLRKLHPDCYTFSTSNGKGQTFIGASPEQLVSLQNHILTTDALAGSAPRGKTATEDANFAKALLNSAKETHEHQVVIDFIVQHLGRLGLKPQFSASSRLLQLSNIQHLWTPIQAQVPANISLLDIVAALHPTPAVAGAPREIACEEIRRFERFERSLYAAPLGWIDGQGNGEFIVGIRSATISGNHARLYAGAGIVAGSDPDKELAEIQLKLQALLKALI